MKKIEILAPAGSEETFMVALNSGADAIYLGLSNFNARAKAQNFTTENIAHYCSLAHAYGTKIFVTVNTLLNDDEIPQMVEMVEACVKGKVDAYIVQDLGVGQVLAKCFPNIILHASTQMGICNLEGAKICEQLGFKRVVLARETKLDDIKAIKQNTNLEIEFFVQGALCVAFSGNCYASSILHEASGNRGKCLQLCRLPYVVNNKSGYFLSPADLCLIKSMKELVDAGVCCFKIEGRLRRSGYVAQTVQTYKKALSAINGQTTIDFDKEIFNLSKVFNRGKYNERAYLDNFVPNYVVNPLFNNHIGVQIGKVQKIQKFKDIFKITIDSKHNLKTGDGLKFFVQQKEVASLGVGNVEKLQNNTFNIYTKNYIQENADVFLTVDSDKENYLVSKTRKLPVDIFVSAKENQPLCAKFQSDKIAVEIASDYICPKAQNNPTTQDEIKQQICKLNDTIFEPNNINVDCDFVFIPKSILNELRRNGTQKLQTALVEENQKSFASIDLNAINEIKSQNFAQNKLQSQFQTMYIFDDKAQLDKINLTQNDVAFFAPKVWNDNVATLLNDLQKNNKTSFGLMMPLIANLHDIEQVDNIVSKINNKPAILSNNLWSLKYIANKHKVVANWTHNIFNHYTLDVLTKLGVCDFVESIEKEKTQNLNLHQYNGCPTLMFFAHCPYKTQNKNTCEKCTLDDKLTVTSQSNQTYKTRRTKISQCYFELVFNKQVKPTCEKQIVDLR